jgi:hypothetical protein
MPRVWRVHGVSALPTLWPEALPDEGLERPRGTSLGFLLSSCSSVLRVLTGGDRASAFAFELR